MRFGSTAFALILLVLVPSFRPAGAATATASFGVSVTVVDTCLIFPSSMGIGSYTRRPASAASAVSVNCLRSTPYVLGIRSSQATIPTLAPERVSSAGLEFAGGTFDLSFERIGSCGRIADTDLPSNFGGNSAMELSRIAQIPAEEYAMASADADSVTVTVTY
jgi:spore coat protein U-like protein